MRRLLERLSIHKKLALAIWGAVLLGFAVAFAGLLLYQSLTLEGRVREAMEPYAQLVSVGTDTAVAFEDPVRAREILDTLRANPQIVMAEIVLNDGRTLAGFGDRPDAPGSQNRSAGIHMNGDVAELTQILPSGGRLHLTMSLRPLLAQRRQIQWLFGAGVLVLIMATLGQLVVLRRTIIRPIAALVEAAEAVRAHGDYSRRVPGAGSDEIARLGQTFNAMMEAVRERESHLRQLTAFQHTILDNAAYGIISTDPGGLVTSFNPAAERLLGYSADEIVGKQTPLLWHDAEEMAQRVRSLSGELGETIAPGFEVFVARARRGLPDESEWTLIRKDGSRVPVLLSATALRDEDDRTTGFLGMLNDLTERKRAEAEIHALNRELEQRVVERTAQLEAAIKELEAFSYSVSHDLRAPLRAINGFSHIVLDEYAGKLDDEGRRYLETIGSNAIRMGELIDDILDFSRMSRQEMARQPVDMTAMAREVFEEVRGAVPERSVTLLLDELPPIQGDRAMIRQVLTNLLANAVKFTSVRSDAVVEVSGVATDGEVTYRVKDNGAGFDMQYVDKLFGVFQRLHDSKEFSGTGIGLAIVKRVVVRHGGRVWAEGKVGEGASIYFTLPRG